MNHKANIRIGFSEFSRKIYSENKNKILNELNASENHWNDYKWQLKNRISDAEELLKYTNLTREECEHIRKISEKYRYAITPYYFSLIDFDSTQCTIKLQ